MRGQCEGKAGPVLEAWAVRGWHWDLGGLLAGTVGLPPPLALSLGHLPSVRWWQGQVSLSWPKSPVTIWTCWAQDRPLGASRADCLFPEEEGREQVGWGDPGLVWGSEWVHS